MDKSLREKYEIPIEKLRYECNPEEFKFKTTKELKPENLEAVIIGQEKALKSIDHGLRMHDKHNHIFAAGPDGTGKNTILRHQIREYLKSKDYKPMVEKRDMVALYNFKSPNNPILVALKPGQGEKFTAKLDDVIKELTTKGMKAYAQDAEAKFREAKKQANETLKPYNKNQNEITVEGLKIEKKYQEIEAKMIEKETKDPKDADIEKDKEELKKLNQKMLNLQKDLRNIKIDMQTHIDNLTEEEEKIKREVKKEWIKKWIKPKIKDLKKEYPSEAISIYLDNWGNGLSEDIGILMNGELAKLAQKMMQERDPTIAQYPLQAPHLDTSKYKANLLHDSTKIKEVPITIEREPTLENLFGIIKNVERRSDHQLDLKNDQHLRLNLEKLGSYIKAHGGYLILDAMGVILNGSWGLLQKYMLNEEAEIRHLFQLYFENAVRSEPIETKVKVILKGENWLYTLLNHKHKGTDFLKDKLREESLSTPSILLDTSILEEYKNDLEGLIRCVVGKDSTDKRSFSHVFDENFKKLYKVKAQFDTTVKNDPTSRSDYAKFISKFCEREGLLHVTPKGVTEVIEQLARDTGTKDKLTLYVGDVENLILEANKEASLAGSKKITEDHVKKAIKDERERHNLIEEKIQEAIAKKVLVINTSEEKIRELNGLAVIDQGDIQFGEPTRITASKPIEGEGGIVSIHEAVKLSGPFDRMGRNILNMIVHERYISPLSEHYIGGKAKFKCTLIYEQAYNMMDGDSASSTGLYVALSSIGQFPLDQSIAVTGRISQLGEVQAIGGVNEKIEGFYKCCKKRGLTGEQGVMIPKINEQHLMLSNEIIDDVKKGKFHIYSVSTIEEGLEALSGLKISEIDEKVKENLKKFIPEKGDK